VVKILGEQVSLDAVEMALRQLLAGGSDCCVIAMPDVRSGGRLRAVSDADISTACRAFNSSCAPFSRIAILQILDRLPRSPLGKLLPGEIDSNAGRIVDLSGSF
jgi:acyl-CoA synthetase (AMP-forming)/AMP-acid ligase II